MADTASETPPDCPDAYCRNNPTAYQRASDDMLHDHTEFCRTPTPAIYVEAPGVPTGRDPLPASETPGPCDECGHVKMAHALDGSCMTSPCPCAEYDPASETPGPGEAEYEREAHGPTTFANLAHRMGVVIDPALPGPEVRRLCVALVREAERNTAGGAV